MRTNKWFLLIGILLMVLVLASCNDDQTPTADRGQSTKTSSEDSSFDVDSSETETPTEELPVFPSETPTPTPSEQPTVSEESLTPSDDLPPFPQISVKNAEIYVGDDLELLTLLVVAEEDKEGLTVITDGGSVDFSAVGSYTVVFTVTDQHGRSKSYTATVTIKERPDTTPPTITGADFEITLGEGVSYKKQVTVSDDTDPYPTITVDNSAVDLENPGVYPIVYTAKDKAGNTATLTLYLTVKEKEEEKDVIEEYVYAEAEKILARITNDSMSDLDVAYAIYRWTKNNVGYWGDTAKGDWVKGAYDTLTTNCGDCYGFYAVSKALLTVAEIDHVDMVKDRKSESATRHYWLLVNVGDGWYHFDTTRFRYPESNFFMLTNEEILAWDETYYPGTHTYITDGVPQIATKSIQDRVDYNSSELKY